MEGGRDDVIMNEFKKLEKLLRDQVLDTKLRFENLQNQNKNIMSRISQVEDMISRNIFDLMSGSEILNNKRKGKPPAIQKGSRSHDILRMSDENLWEPGLEPGIKDRGELSWEPGLESRISEPGEPGETGEPGEPGEPVPGSKQSLVGPFPSSPSLEYQSTDEPKFLHAVGSSVSKEEGGGRITQVRTYSSPNIRHSQSMDINTTLRTPKGFPSTHSFRAELVESLQNNINYFKHISGPNKQNTWQSADKVYNDLYPKNNAQKQNVVSPIPVLEMGRSGSSQSQRSKFLDQTKPDSESNQLNLEQNMDEDATVYLNVGGKRFEILWNTLGQYPTSRLGRLYSCSSHTEMLEICDRYILTDCEFFFDRSPRHFESILNLYRTGQLHMMEGVCVQAFAEELAYWGLDDLHLEPCCMYAFYRMKQFLPGNKEEEKEEVDEFGPSRFNRARKWVWEMFEEPNKTKLGKVIAVISIGFVIVSTLALILSTIPAFQVTDPDSNETNEHPDFAISEAIFITWFTVEYVIRFIASPQKWRFIKEGMNVIDLLGIVPYFVSLGLSNMKSSGEYQDEMRRIAQVFRIMRILRIFRLGRHITGLQTLGATLKASYKELGLLALVVIMGMLIFSGLTFVVEKDANPDEFISMPAALYWAIITMTSVGYGDITPKTWFGKLVGACCAISGVLIISLPIPIIVNTFNKLYEKAKIKNQIMKKKKMAGWQDFKKTGFQKPATFSISDPQDQGEDGGCEGYDNHWTGLDKTTFNHKNSTNQLVKRSRGSLEGGKESTGLKADVVNMTNNAASSSTDMGLTQYNTSF